MANTDTTMPPEVAEATDALNLWLGSDEPRWSLIRDHLHRLAEENARLRERNAALESKATRDHQWITDLLDANAQAEAERDAIKAKIAAAPVEIRNVPIDRGIAQRQFAIVRLPLEDGE